MHDLFSIFFASHPVCCEDRTDVKITPELVYTVFEQQKMLLRLAQVLYAMTLRPECAYVGRRFSGNPPVCTHNTVIAIFLPEKVLNQICTVGASYIPVIS